MARRPRNDFPGSWHHVVNRAIADGTALNDPLELRPLPLAGIPGWYPGQDARFFAEAECFQPVRAGRVYPPPL